MSDGVMTYEDWLRGCVHHDGRNGYVTLPCDEVLKIADFIEKLRADRKTESSSEKPNNCEDEPKPCEWCKFYDGENCYSQEPCKVKTEPNCSEIPNNCDTCKWGEWYRNGYDITMMSDECGGCCSWNSKWTPKDEPKLSEIPTGSDEPQTETSTNAEKVQLTDEPQTCEGCKRKGEEGCEQPCLGCNGCGLYESTDEPQTEHRDCINCESADCAKCRGFKDEPQTERSE